MSRWTRQPRDEEGFTLVEVIIAALVLVVGVLGVLGMLDQANKAASRTKAREAGVSLAREVIEAAHAVPYPSLQPSTILAQLQAQPGLGDAVAGGGWQVVRRNRTYTVTASVCSLDDAKDGQGVHTGVTFCTDSAGAGTTDTNPDDYKRVSIVVTWSDQAGGTAEVRQAAVINNAGSAFAPSVTTLTPNPAGTITAGTTSVSFTATTSAAQELRWYLDNVQKGVVSGPASSFAFTWDLTGVVDGSYDVSASAYDKYGETGAPRTQTVVINRFAPAQPTGLMGGRDALWGATVVDLKWNPNPERDVTGYQVYRMTGATPSNGDTLVCTTATTDATPYACTDATAPAAGILNYYVRAVAPNHTTGPATELSDLPTLLQTLTVGISNQAPTAPGSVTAGASGSGTTTLSWTAATDPDIGGSIKGYRIYRDDNTSYTKRYDITGSGADLSWTDPTTGSITHRYWVTAIDDKLAESPFAPAAGVTG